MPSKPEGNILIRFLHRIEDAVLILLLMVMISMAVLQIILRNVLDSGILWGDGLVRVLVLWIGLIGAMIASRTNHHISIDVISRYLPSAVRPVSDLCVALFTALICMAMTYHSFAFVRMEKSDGMTAFASVPAWICESIIPFAFGVISIRYLILFLLSLYRIFRPEHS